ncbi:hypothetical protein ACEN9H_02030 [Massilia cellulosiltytica]|uniref:hypothetical protein n=1 Tax=Massilia cellulosiltytica TaxID=2683234 RepID=UPI0039B4D5A9
MTTIPDLPCLPLDSPRWQELEHAYGKAADIPALLRQLASLPPSGPDDEPWFSLWSALAHQGDVYAASFAAVPHVVRALALAPDRAGAVYLQFPAWVEICRKRERVVIPSDLQDAYAAALAALPGLVAAAAVRAWDEEFLACALAALAAVKGSVDVAEAALELTPEVAGDFLRWLEDR